MPEDIKIRQDRLALLKDRDDVETDRLASAYGELGKVYAGFHYWEEAKPCLLNAAALAPKAFEWPYYTAHVCKDLGQIEEAIIFFRKAQLLNTRFVPTYLHLGQLFLEQQQFADAEQQFQRALDMEPQSAIAQHGLASIAFARGDFSRTIALLKPMTRTHPQSKALRSLLGLAYRETGDLVKAREYLENPGNKPFPVADPLLRSLKDFSLGQSQLLEGRRFMASEQYAKAVEAFIAVLAEEPQNVHARLGLARVFYSMKQTDQARREFERVLRIDPDNARALYYLGTQALLASDLERAADLLRASLAINPAQKDGQFNLGKTYGRLKRYKEASAHFGQATRQDPGNDQAIYWQIFYLLKARSFKQADALIQVGLEAFPHSQAIRSLAIRFWSTCPETQWLRGQRALELSEQWEEPSNGLQKNILQGMALANVGQFSKAIKVHKKALSEADHHPDLSKALHKLLVTYRANKPCRELFWFENLQTTPSSGR